MAWGVLMNDLRRNYQSSGWYVHFFGSSNTPMPSAESLLFGSLISVTQRDVAVSLVVGSVILLLGAAFFKEIIFFMFDETVARVYGVSTTFFHYMLLAVLAVTVVLGVRLAGFVLVSALLVIPGATAVLLTRRLGLVFFLSWVVGLLGVVAGLMISLQAGKLSSGPCIVGMLCLLFGLAFAFKSLRGRLGLAARA
jgi:zinc transport system permease protein